MVSYFSIGKTCDTMDKKLELGVYSMSIDILQDKIRKAKNPSALVLEAFGGLLPPEVSLKDYYTQLLTQLKGLMPAVRFGFGSFAALR